MICLLPSLLSVGARPCADSVLQLAAALNLSRPDVLGWSTGGDIALILAALHGDKVGRVIGLGAMAGSNHTGALI
jgi:pimeloyl-ACP methyl ester carboxylesterase